MGPADELELLRILARTELAQTLIAIILALGIAFACWLLWVNGQTLAQLEAQLVARNTQGQQALILLDEAVKKLEQR
jgi:uncharacterized SAM-binding protein YcdF (DUF218 family)